MGDARRTLQQVCDEIGCLGHFAACMRMALRGSDAHGVAIHDDLRDTAKRALDIAEQRIGLLKVEREGLTI